MAAAPSYTIGLLAGAPGGAGYADGTGSIVRFYDPYGVTVDASGNLYVADTVNLVIRKVTPAGAVSTLAGDVEVPGSADGTGTAATFALPEGMTIDASGNLYVADATNETIRKITAAGVVTTLAGMAGTAGSADGTGTAASFKSPRDVAIDGGGNLYVADSGNDTIRKITPAGVVTTLAGTAGTSGSSDGTGSAALFNNPRNLGLDSSGNVYVADTNNNVIRKITPAGVVTTLAGTAGTAGSNDGSGAAAQFDNPRGIGVDANGNVYVADYGNLTIRRITPTGEVTTLAGTAGIEGSADGTGAAAQFASPNAVTVDGSGNLYVTDVYNDTIRKVTAAGVVTTVVGSPAQTGSMDGVGSAARFDEPAGFGLDSSGNLFVADYLNNTIRKVTAAGVVTTLAGTAGTGGSSDGTGAAAQFSSPDGVTVDSADNVYVADSGNDTIRKITPAGVVTTLAGTAGMAGSSDGTGSAALFNDPDDVAVDSSGNVYVVDAGNYTIRKITPAGVVTTVAGTAGTSGSADGTGAAAQFGYPVALTVDGSGNLFVTDGGNNTIRKITAAGVVTTIAGTAGVTGNQDGTGPAAQFNFPDGISVDASGNLYVADYFNGLVRMIDPTGVVTTLLGTRGIASFEAGASPGIISFPTYVRVKPDASEVAITIENEVVTAKLATSTATEDGGVGTSGAIGESSLVVLGFAALWRRRRKA